jgi:hypothetical protein
MTFPGGVTEVGFAPIAVDVGALLSVTVTGVEFEVL